MIRVLLGNVAYDDGIEFVDTGTGRVSILVDGHSLSGPRGEDIICAAVSVTAQTMIIGISRIAGIEQSCIQKDGYLKTEISVADLPDEKMEKLRIILDIFCIGIFETLNAHPGSLDISFDALEKNN